MTIEFVGLVGNQDGSESRPSTGPVVNKPYVSLSARAHESGGFDRVLIGYSSFSPDGIQLAAYLSHRTERLSPLVAHRPGFVAPTLAARTFATLDQLNGGRAAINFITGGHDAEQQRDGDFLAHDERYERTDEYIVLLKRVWTSGQPFDHEGRYYKVAGAFSEVKPVHGHIPIYFSGSSDAAIRVAAKHADVYMLWGEPVEQVRDVVRRVRAAAAEAGRENAIRFSLSLRPVLADTEEAAWRRADEILERAKATIGQSPRHRLRPGPPQNVGSQRLLAVAAQGKVVDKRLWTEIAALSGAGGNSTGLVGTPAQVAESLLDYYDAGITTFLIRGFDPLRDAVQYGQELIPLTRALVAQRAAGAAPALEARAA
ncbi:LLM class flavin-dependent oxidoreductase [Xylophilus sp.]|uniref:LLM class flavin-dependent oxidoreductase n=1 Tax=Xylophilus sp. TaxID=2653893 RepID=UPI0013B6FBF0|nr:LLM class flavin-dependent oxidoreductase [Xylophilus sp.]KAF1042888.1 MAG: Alkanesulfonate monooxygenase [Xylophilus sp.]